MDVLSLYNICIKKTMNLIQQGYWLSTKPKLKKEPGFHSPCSSRSCVLNMIPLVPLNKCSCLPRPNADSESECSYQPSTSADIKNYVLDCRDFVQDKPICQTLPTPVINEFENPFSVLPSLIVDDILIRMCASWKEVSDFTLLLKSGRVQHFRMEPPNFYHYHINQMVEILLTLSGHCQNLKSVVIRLNYHSYLTDVLTQTRGLKRSYFEYSYPTVFKQPIEGDRIPRTLTAALELLLSSCPLVEFVESNIGFDLKVLRKCYRLQCLNINFEFRGPLTNLLENINGEFLPNNSLKKLSANGIPKFKILRSGFPELLKYCHALTEIHALDVSFSLRNLHLEGLYHGISNKKYKLRTCFLGCGEWKQLQLWDRNILKLQGELRYSLPEATYENAIHILAATCPLVEKLYIIADFCDFSGLSSLNHLNLLSIRWSPEARDFKLVNSFFINVVENLKSLSLANVINVDFEIIDKACPNLEELYVWFENYADANGTSSTCYKKLKYLILCNTGEDHCSIEQKNLISMLSNCRDLKVLVIVIAGFLTDEILITTLKKNDLAKVEKIVLMDSSLTRDGVKYLVKHLQSLQELYITSSLVNEAIILNLIRKFNKYIEFRA